MRASGMVLVAGLVLLVACSDTAGPSGGSGGSTGEPAPSTGALPAAPRAPAPDPGAPGAGPEETAAPSCSVGVQLIEEDPGPGKC